MKQRLTILAMMILTIGLSTSTFSQEYGIYTPKKKNTQTQQQQLRQQQLRQQQLRQQQQYQQQQYPQQQQYRPKDYSYNNNNTYNNNYNTTKSNNVERGYAVFYADYLHGQSTALGEIYNKYELTCAHKTLPLGTLIKVTRVDNGQSVTVRVNDRGPYDEGVVVDLSWSAANKIGLIRSGRTIVQIESVGFSNTNPTNPTRPKGAQYRYGGTQPQSYSNTGITRKGIDASQIKKFPTGQTGFAIQLASYTNYSNAQRQILNYHAQGVEYLYIKDEHNPSGTLLHKIIIAPFNDKLQAQQYLANIRMKHEMDGLVIKLR